MGILNKKKKEKKKECLKGVLWERIFIVHSYIPILGAQKKYDYVFRQRAHLMKTELEPGWNHAQEGGGGGQGERIE